MDRPPATVTVTLLLIRLNAVFWLGFALLTVLGAIPSIPAGLLRWVLAVPALGAGALLAGLAWSLRRRRRPAFYAAAVLLAAVAVLSLTDQVGLPDLLALAVSLAALGLLLKDRAWYLRPGGPARE